MSTPDLKVRVGDVELSNPVIAASGTFGYGAEFAGPDLRQKLSVDCEKHAAAEYERCDLYFPDMLKVI